VDYSATTDNIAVVVELDATKTTQYVLVDGQGATFTTTGDMATATDRVDYLVGVERIVAANNAANESILDLTSSTKGLEVRYSSTSVGGKRGIQTLAVAIAAQVDTDPTMPVPVVTLGKEFYMHKSFGKIYTPLFDVQSWIGMNGEDEAPEPEPAAPARRRRS
jgi:hypothetical protein